MDFTEIESGSAIRKEKAMLVKIEIELLWPEGKSIQEAILGNIKDQCVAITNSKTKRQCNGLMDTLSILKGIARYLKVPDMEIEFTTRRNLYYSKKKTYNKKEATAAKPTAPN